MQTIKLGAVNLLEQNTCRSLVAPRAQGSLLLEYLASYSTNLRHEDFLRGISNLGKIIISKVAMISSIPHAHLPSHLDQLPSKS